MVLHLRNVFLVAILVAPLCVSAAQNGKQTNAQKADERRENESVRKAQQDVKTTQQAETTAERSFKKAVDELKAAERQLVQAASQLQKVKDDLEEKYSATHGLNDARTAAEVARREYDRAGQPFLQKLAETPKYQQAVEAARQADLQLTRLRNETDTNADDRRKAIAEAARVKLIPAQLQRETLDSEPSLKPQRARLTAAEDAVAKLRKQVDQAIDKDAALRAVTDKIENLKQEIATARKSVSKEERDLAAARQKLTREQQDLQQKILADKRDDNKPNNKKK